MAGLLLLALPPFAVFVVGTLAFGAGVFAAFAPPRVVSSPESAARRPPWRATATCRLGWPPSTRRFSVPHHAEVTLGVAVCVLVLVADLRGAIAFSSFGVLL